MRSNNLSLKYALVDIIISYETNIDISLYAVDDDDGGIDLLLYAALGET
jgi:hypothetical protein